MSENLTIKDLVFTHNTSPTFVGPCRCGTPVTPADLVAVLSSLPETIEVDTDRLYAEQDLACEHGVVGRNHNIMDGASVAAKCIAPTLVTHFADAGRYLVFGPLDEGDTE
jgi:hypothetical protein